MGMAMSQSVLLVVSGRDRPGIVARVSEVLFRCQCNIEDSSMTRLRREFTVMLILRLPDALVLSRLREDLATALGPWELTLHLQPLLDEAAWTDSSDTERWRAVINVLGADHPGIVYGISRVLEEEHGNITDLYTQMAGTPDKPVYVMTIEAEMLIPLERLNARLSEEATRLNVDISVREAETFTL
jgi:glycine cleavage system transcriptional repressor